MKMKVKIDRSSVAKVLSQIRQKQTNISEAGERAVARAGQAVFDKAQMNVPVMTGALKRSGRVDNKIEGNKITATISYGDSTLGYRGVPTSDYAITRHEMYTSKKPEAYKWLERAVLSSDEAFLTEIMATIKSELQ